MVSASSEDVRCMEGLVGPIASMIKQKQKSHRKGPSVDPLPGPNNGQVEVLVYEASDTPNGVLIKWVVFDHVLLREAVDDGGAPNQLS